MSWQCFWVEQTGEAQRSLRRYSADDEVRCPLLTGDLSYHNASLDIERHPLVTNADGYTAGIEPYLYRNDPRWPTHCKCGYEFLPTDHWQVNQDAVYRAKSGEEFAQRKLPIGAMLNLWWDSRVCKKYPDGVKLGVVLPPGGDVHLWCVDGPSTREDGSQGPGWTRSGEIPNVTALPSILTDRYHGWLKDGVLSNSLPDRPDPFA